MIKLPTHGMPFAWLQLPMEKSIESKPFQQENTAHRNESGQSADGIFELQSEASFLLKSFFSPLLGGKNRDLLKSPYLQLFYYLDEFLGTLIHDGRNHLGPVKGYASLIAASERTGSQKARWTNRIMESVEAMERYFDLLSIFRVKGASLIKETTCGEILYDAVETLRLSSYRDISVEVTSEVPDRLPLHREIIKRVIVHLLRNAHESTANGEVINISALRNREGSSSKNPEMTILLKVKDHGKGIAESKKPLICQPFYSTKPGHFGLGLTYVSMAAFLLDANIKLESQEGFGSTFLFSFQPKGGEIEFPKATSS